jgi:DNA-directed RNA polymerase subunit RPC12/RpoP
MSKNTMKTSAQLHCLKCGAMDYSVAVSALEASNGRVTCSNCGHVRLIKFFSAAKQRTSPSATGGRGNAEAIPASLPGGNLKF